MVYNSGFKRMNDPGVFGIYKIETYISCSYVLKLNSHIFNIVI